MDSAGYQPAVDVSTAYYAEHAIATLVDPDKLQGISLRRLLAEVRQLQVWSSDSPQDDAEHLSRAVGRLYGFPESAKGELSFVGVPIDTVGWYGPGGQLLRLLFGLQCLSRIIDAICLGRGIHFIPGTGYSGFALERIAPTVFRSDQQQPNEPLWTTVTADNSDAVAYESWLKKGPATLSARNISSLVSDAAANALTMPFVDLAGNLYDTSAGMYTPMAEDARSPEALHRWLSPQSQRAIAIIEKGLRGSFYSCLSVYPWLLGRMVGYLRNGLCYQQICFINGWHYIQNSVRAPFLYALHKSGGDRSLILDALMEAVGVVPHHTRQTPGAVPQSRLGREPFLFALVLAAATTAADILPSAYRLREALTPLRMHIQEKGWDGHFHTTFTDLLNYLKLREKVRQMESVDLKVLRVSVPGPRMAWLYEPYYWGRKRFANSIRIVVDEYRKLYSVAERLETLVFKR